MRLSHLIALVGVCFGMGLWAGCTVDLSDPGPGHFQCASSADCLEGYECRADNLCHELTLNNQWFFCIDNDGDGYGVGTIEERQGCPLCESQGLCDEDCDDSDKTRNPGAGEACNGRDDNCNDDIDEPTTCASAQDCQALSPYIPANTSVTCENQRCVVKMNNQFCTPARNDCPCAEPVACEASAYMTPAECI